MKTFNIVSISLALAATWLPPVALAATLTVSKTGGNASSPLLYGIMFEVCGCCSTLWVGGLIVLGIVPWLT